MLFKSNQHEGFGVPGLVPDRGVDGVICDHAICARTEVTGLG